MNNLSLSLFDNRSCIVLCSIIFLFIEKCDLIFVRKTHSINECYISEMTECLFRLRKEKQHRRVLLLIAVSDVYGPPVELQKYTLDEPSSKLSLFSSRNMKRELDGSDYYIDNTWHLRCLDPGIGTLGLDAVVRNES